VITIKVDGLREIMNALHELPRATSKNVARRVMKARAVPIAEAARRLVPVGSGSLKKSIKVSTKLTKRQRSQFRKDSPNDVVVFVGPGAHPQAHMQEFGTWSNRAQPYMRPAWAATWRPYLDGVGADMWVEIERAAARIARKAARAGR